MLNYLLHLILCCPYAFILAAVSRPKFKPSWIDDPAEKARCTHMLESVCESVATDVQSDSDNAQSTDEDCDQFFVLHDEFASFQYIICK